jgi:hypothetical protein
MGDHSFYDSTLPAGRESFSVRELAQIFSLSIAHLNGLIDAGELGVIDPSAKKSCRRISREQIVEFLQRRSVKQPKS